MSRSGHRPDEFADFVRSALHAAADQVEPHADGLERIREKIRSRPAHASQPRLVAMRLAIAGCFARLGESLRSPAPARAGSARQAPRRPRSISELMLRPALAIGVTVFAVGVVLAAVPPFRDGLGNIVVSAFSGSSATPSVSAAAPSTGPQLPGGALPVSVSSSGNPKPTPIATCSPTPTAKAQASPKVTPKGTASPATTTSSPPATPSTTAPASPTDSSTPTVTPTATPTHTAAVTTKPATSPSVSHSAKATPKPSGTTGACVSPTPTTKPTGTTTSSAKKPTQTTTPTAHPSSPPVSPSDTSSTSATNGGSVTNPTDSPSGANGSTGQVQPPVTGSGTPSG